jgi:hypothetical protein
MADMSKYAGASFIKFEDVAHGSRTEKIVAVSIGGYDRPVAKFEGGDSLSLNSTNVKTLIKNYGKDNHDWLGCVVELYAGETDFKGEKKDSVLLRPISPVKPFDERTPPAPRKYAPDDDIPF